MDRCQLKKTSFHARMDREMEFHFWDLISWKALTNNPVLSIDMPDEAIHYRDDSEKAVYVGGRVSFGVIVGGMTFPGGEGERQKKAYGDVML